MECKLGAGAATFDVSGSTGIDQSSTAYSVFGDGGTSEVYARTESWRVTMAPRRRRPTTMLLVRS